MPKGETSRPTNKTVKTLMTYPDQAATAKRSAENARTSRKLLNDLGKTISRSDTLVNDAKGLRAVSKATGRSRGAGKPGKPYGDFR